MANMTRRMLLGSAGAVALGGVAYGVSYGACRFVPRNHPDFFSLLEVAPEGAAARSVGWLALVSTALPSDLPGLAAALTARPLIRDAMTSGCATTRGDRVKEQCALDFEEGRIVTLDGWMLSETEAAICAARALCPQPV